VHIIEPAFVERVGDGWKLKSIGILEIVDADAQTDALSSEIPIQADFPVRERSALFSASLLDEEPAVMEKPNAGVMEKPVAVTCADCGKITRRGVRCTFRCCRRGY
jgi:hypothetical protein